MSSAMRNITVFVFFCYIAVFIFAFTDLTHRTAVDNDFRAWVVTENEWVADRIRKCAFATGSEHKLVERFGSILNTPFQHKIQAFQFDSALKEASPIMRRIVACRPVLEGNSTAGLVPGLDADNFDFFRVLKSCLKKFSPGYCILEKRWNTNNPQTSPTKT
jgi:hypothetical protein